MSAFRRLGDRKILDQLSREARLSVPLLRQMERELEGQDWLDPSLVGRLYEREVAGKEGRQKAQGSFFTPDYLVDFVVKYTLEPLLRGLDSKAVCKLRIADPSCGGGAFLLGVLRYLESHCVAAGAKRGPALRRRLCRTLVGVDLDPSAIEVTRAALRLAVGGSGSLALSAHLLVGDALLPDTPIGKIDAIVGNPPWGQKGLRIDSETRARYRELFTCASGVWDPFKRFVERSHQLLRPGGRWGLVLPDIVLLKNLQCVRDVILDGSAIEELAHCGRAFVGANIDAVALVATRVAAPPAPAHTLRVWPHLPADWSRVTPSSRPHLQRVFTELPGHKFNLYLHGDSLELYRRLRDCPRLGDRLGMHEGVHSGNSRGKLFVDRAHSTHCRPLVLGRKELAPYQLEWAGRYLDTDPAALDRASGDYANLGRAEWHTSEKIVVRRTGDRVMAAYDREGLYVSNNMFVLLSGLAKENAQSRQQLRAMVAMLNSRFMTWYFRAIQPRVGRLFAELKLVHLRDFPLPSDSAWKKIVGPLAELTDKARVSGAPSVADEVDTLVESAFQISPQEREVIKLSQ